jgi:hypothetical protein
MVGESKMKRLIFSIAFIITVLLYQAYSADDIKGGILDKNVNSDDEDYGSYVIYGNSMDTLFFTSSRPVPNRRPIAMSAEMFFSVRASDSRKRGMKINEGWSQAKQIVADASKIAEFTRGSQAISSDRIIFAAERDLTNKEAKGTSYLFDLWEMTRRVDGFSNPEPINEVNDVDAWDSQPALSIDGKVLYFVSNRAGGMGGLDIWYSVRGACGMWSKPQLVPNINTKGDEVSPHCGADGKFYYSSDWNYEKGEKGTTGRDIYRAEYRDYGGLVAPVNPVSLDNAFEMDASKYGVKIPSDIKYNSDKDDEFPFIAPDRSAIFLTSNRSADFEKRNIYSFSLPKSRIMLQVNVSEQILDSKGNILIPPTAKVGLPLKIVDIATGVEKDIRSGEKYEVDADKSYQVRFSKFVEEECYQNKIEGPNEMKIGIKKPFGYDTTYFLDALISRRKIEIPPIVFFSTDTLPYFVTGYWYPNTSENLEEYRKREAGGMFDQTGFIDSTGHDYMAIAPRIDKEFSSKIYEPLARLLPGFQDFCQDTLYLKVTIHGHTDPRGLSAGNEHPYRPKSRFKRIYPDETVSIGTDEKGNSVTIKSGLDMFDWNWQEDSENKQSKWIRLQDEGQEGNILLSKLRAYYTFVTFDKQMQKLSPIYSQLRDQGRVILDAEGYGIDKKGYDERKLRDDPQSRRIEIYLDLLRPEEIATHKRLEGGIVKEVAATAKEPVKPKDAETEEIAVTKGTEAAEEKNTTEKQDDTVVKDDIKPTDEALSMNKPLPPPPVERIPDAPKPIEEGCYSIQYSNYETAGDAEQAMKILSEYGVIDPKVSEYLDQFGSRSYRLRSGCFKTVQEAFTELDKNINAVKALGIKKKPVVVR